jgi:KUP system potassium uptake protein
LNELDFCTKQSTYFLSRETDIPIKRIGMARRRESLFTFLLKHVNSNLKYFHLPLTEWSNWVRRLRYRSKQGRKCGHVLFRVLLV